VTVTERGKRATRAEVLAELQGTERFLLVTHEHPDGDALGSLLAMNEILRALGKDSLMFMAADEFPLPYEYRFFDFDGLVSVPPDDAGERTVVFLDCGNIDRNPRTSSTSTTTTTTPTSGSSTTSCRRPPARPRSCGT
jgi:phosphoesterase RecJ-like protein